MNYINATCKLLFYVSNYSLNNKLIRNLSILCVDICNKMLNKLSLSVATFPDDIHCIPLILKSKVTRSLYYSFASRYQIHDINIARCKHDWCVLLSMTYLPTRFINRTLNISNNSPQLVALLLRFIYTRVLIRQTRN